MNFIKKIFDNKTDELVHLQFQKFSKGEFKDKAVIKAKNSSGKYTISTTYEFANELVRDLAEKLNEKTKVTGVIVSTNDLKEKLDFKGIKQFMGVKQYQIDKEMSKNEIIELLNKFPKAFFGLSFKTSDSELKIKPKAPKSAKPSNKSDEKPNPDFCKLITTDKQLAESFVFEKNGFKQALISHNFIIKEIIIPNELKNEKDFSVIREKSLRKGILIREGEIDGNSFKKEIEFEA